MLFKEMILLRVLMDFEKNIILKKPDCLSGFLSHNYKLTVTAFTSV